MNKQQHTPTGRGYSLFIATFKPKMPEQYSSKWDLVLPTSGN